MPVQWKQVPIPFTAGVDTKSDRKTIRTPKLTVLENGVFTERASIVKRPGYDALSTDTTETVPGTITDARALSSRDEELVLFDPTKLYGYQEATGGWVPRSDFDAMTLRPEVVSDTVTNQVQGTCGTEAGITVVAWQDSGDARESGLDGGIRFSVIDESTGVYYAHEQQIEDAVSPRVIVINGFIHILHLVDDDGSDGLHTFIINPADVVGSLAGATLQITPDAEVSHYDAEPYGDGTAAAVAWRDIGTNEVTVAYIQGDGTLGAPASGYPAPRQFNETCEDGVCIATEATDEVFFVGCLNATGVRGLTIDADFAGSFTELGTRTTIEVNGAIDGSQITAVYLANASPTPLRIFWEKPPNGAPVAADTSNYRVHIATGDSVGDTYGTPVVYRHSGLHSRAFRRLNHGYVQTVFDADLLKTGFILRDDGRWVGKINPGTARGVKNLPGLSEGSAAMLANVDTVVADSEYEFCTDFRARLEADDDSTAIFASHSVKRVSLKFAQSDTSYTTAEARRSLFVASGYVYQYDGANPVEAGFHAFPDPDAISEVSAGGGSMVPGDYAYVWLYEWDDLNGGRQQSGGIRKTLTVGGGDSRLTITIPTLAQTLKQDAFGRTGVKIVGYRSQVNPGPGAPLYRITDPDPAGGSGHVVNDPDADSVTYVDNEADATITNNEIFYGNSGEQINIAPESGSIVLQAKDRLFLSGVENQNSVFFSKFFTDECSPGEFFPAFVFDVDDEGGPITALGLVNDVLVVFKERRLFAVTGDGPDAAGRGQQFSLPQLITSDAGCIDQRSVVDTPVGLMFQSRKGIYLLDQGLRLRYIGADVEGFNAQTITSAILIADRNEVRFLTDDGSTLVYNYFFNQWSTFTNHEGIAAALWRNVYTYARSVGQVLTENEAKFLDNTTAYKLRIRTAWLTVGGVLQGFMRVRRSLFLMDFKSLHTMRLRVGYDFEQVLLDEYTFDPSATVNTGTWGSQPTWGDDTVWGGAGSSVYQWQAKLSRQKCQAVQFEFEDVPPEEAGESFEITEMLMEVGLRKGPFKLREAVNATAVSGSGGGGSGGGIAGSASPDVTGAT